MIHRTLTALLMLGGGALPAAAQNYLLDTLGSPSPGPNELLGAAVDVSASTVLAGAYGYSEPGVSGSGAAWLYERDASGVWGTPQKLLPSDLPPTSRFGYAVSLSDERAAVGAYRDGTLGFDAGSVYIYERQVGGTWLETQKLVSADLGSGDNFGFSVELDGDFLIVGAPQAKVGTTRTGAAYVFQRQPDGTWTEEAKLAAADGSGNDRFGWSASLRGTRVVAGAYLDDDNGNSSGSAYVFDRQADGTWTESAKLLPSDGASFDNFGFSVSVSGDLVVSGAWLTDDAGGGSGSAYVFERQAGGGWSELQILHHDAPSSGDWFGQDVVIDGDLIVVGALNDTVGFKSKAGSAHVFKRPAGGLFAHIGQLVLQPTQSDENFGTALGLDGGWIAVGAANGDQFASDAGQVQVSYEYAGSDTAPPLAQGTGTPGCAGPQSMGTNLPPLIGTPGFALTSDAAPLSTKGFLLLGNAADVAGSDVLNLGVLLHVDLIFSSFVMLLPMVSDAAGNATGPLPLPNDPNLAGAVLHAQSVWIWSSCSLPPLGLSSSNLLTFTITGL